MAGLIRWLLWLLRAFWKGACWLLLAFFALLGATADWDPALEKWRSWGLHDLANTIIRELAKITFGDFIIWILAIGLSSFFVWIIHTKPRRQIKEDFFDELERRYPGLKDQTRGRRARRRERGRRRQ